MTSDFRRFTDGSVSEHVEIVKREIARQSGWIRRRGRSVESDAG